LNKGQRKNKWKIKLATWNVRGIDFKDQLDDILAKKKERKKEINIAAISETKKQLKGLKETNNFIQVYSGVNANDRAHSGVMLMIHKSLKSNTDSYSYWSDRIIQVRLKLSRGYFTVLCNYAPTEGQE
jgi:exonuclease III